MKKTVTDNAKVKKATVKKTKKVAFEPKYATIHLDITGVDTYEDMVYELASAKIFTDNVVSGSEARVFTERELALLLKLNGALIDGLFETNRTLLSELKWAKRPWYKKLMFWKKNPNRK